MDAQGVAVQGHGDRLVERDPLRHPVTEPPAGGRAVLGEPLRRGPVHPAAAVLQGQRSVPVVEGGHGGDAGLQQPVDQPVVEVQALRVERAAARPAGSAARRWRSGRSPCRGPASAPRLRASGCSGRRPPRGSGRPGCCRAFRRRHPSRTGPRPPAARAPSIWKAAEATPRVKSGLQARGKVLNCDSSPAQSCPYHPFGGCRRQ